jgi:hypothetical protein
MVPPSLCVIALNDAIRNGGGSDSDPVGKSAARKSRTSRNITLEIAAIAPRAVIIDNTNDDYADNAEGDAIGYEGAKPVFQYLGAVQNLALDLYMGGGGHSLKPAQAANIVSFANMVLYGKPLAEGVRAQRTTDPYLNAGTYDHYYGGMQTIMPWAGTFLGNGKF